MHQHNFPRHVRNGDDPHASRCLHQGLADQKHLLEHTRYKAGKLLALAAQRLQPCGKWRSSRERSAIEIVAGAKTMREALWLPSLEV